MNGSQRRIPLVVPVLVAFGGVWPLLAAGPGTSSAPTSALDATGAFDHSVLHRLLQKHVDDAGWVNYADLAADSTQLDAYVSSLARAPLDQLGRDDKLALLINAYNAFTLRLILDYWNDGKLESIKRIPTEKCWTHARWNVGGRVWSLDQIENEQIRPEFREPRVHFALVCAAVSCPPLRNEAYTGDRLERQLEQQTRYVHAYAAWYHFDPALKKVSLTPLYDWYGGDFDHAAGSVLDFAAKYDPSLDRALKRGAKLRVEWLDYDWRLNDVRHKSPR